MTELTSSGALAGTFDPDGIFATPYGIAFDAAGDAWVTDPGVSGVVELTSSGALAAELRSADSVFSFPYGIAIDTSGNVWVQRTWATLG